MNRKIFFAIIAVFFGALVLLEALWAGQYFRIRGFFLPNDSWTGGHPGKVTFDIGDSNSGYAATIDTAWYLSGYFWLGNVGWATFSHQEWATEYARINCPEEVFRDPTVVCPATGFAWSQNAWWIALSGSFIWSGWVGYSTWVYYNPAAGILQWFGHSQALGYIPFYGQAGSPIDTWALDQTGIILDGIGVNFVWKIAIIGNIAGTRIYNITNQNVWYVFNSINQAEILNTIRKNIALASRNIPNASLMAGSGIEFVYKKNPSFDHSTFFDPWPINARSIIIEWKDIIIDSVEVGDPLSTRPKALIALKDANGSGWNIVITKNVERIYAFLYAEGSIYSGEKTTTTDPIVSYISSWAWNIPAQQLYIKWWLISKNTIWWAVQTPSVCPVVITNCDTLTSQLYDMNYFRTYDPMDPDQESVPSPLDSDIRFDRSSIVIDYNSAITSDPPPGLQSIIQ